MQKKFVAAAIAGLLTAPAFAGDNVTLYGLIDFGYSFRTDNYNSAISSRSSFDSGIANGTRLGVRGSEDLMPGVKGVFTLEAGINADTGTTAQGSSGSTTRVCTNATCTTTANAVTTEQTDRVWGRQAFVGLDFNGTKLLFGRQYTPIYNNYYVVDPFGLGTSGQVNNIFKHITSRADNAVTVNTPYFGEMFAVEAMYSNRLSGNEASGNTGDARYYALFPKVKFGKTVTVIGGYTNEKVKGASTEKTSFDLLGDFNFSVVRVALAYARYEDGTKVAGEDKKYDRFLVGGRVPMGNTTLLASYNYSKDKNNLKEKAQQFALGATYAFSKRTDLYTVYSQINTDDAVTSGYEVSDGSNSGMGYRRGFNLGLRHRF